MKNKLDVRQICFILIAYSMAGKLLMMPAQLSYFAKNGLWISVLIPYALQTAAVWAVSLLCSRTDKTFFGLLCNTFGNAAARVVICLFALYFAAAAFLPLCEQKLFVHEIFYDTVPALTVFVPFFFLSVYVGGKWLNNAGRTADIMLFLFLAAFAIIMVMSAHAAQPEWLLPISGAPLKGILKGAAATFYNFTDGAVMLMFMGRFKYRRGDCAKITLSYVFGGLLVTAYLAVFYSVFSTLSPDEYFSVAKSAIFFPALSVTGRTDLIAVYVIEIAMLFGLILLIQLCVQCLCDACGGRAGPLAISFAVNGVLLILLFALGGMYRGLQGVYGNILCYVFAFFTLAAPALAWLLDRGKDR